MEIKSAQAERFMQSPPPGLRALLLYGPDAGLARERAEAAVRAVAGSVSDPFRVVELTGAQLARDPARLADEAASLSFGGGARVVWVREAGEGLLDSLKDFLASLPGEALVVVEAGDLPKRAALVRLFEKQGPTAAALACYRDEGRGLEQLIAQTLQAEGVKVTRDGLAYLAANLGGDRGLTRQELAKLALYGRGRREPLGLAEVSVSVGDSAALSLDDLALAVADGDVAGTDRALQRSLAEGASPVALLRAVSRHFQRLHFAAGLARTSGELDGALRRLRPPVFWKQAPRFKAQVHGWPAAALGSALSRLLEAEARCKQTGMPDATLCAETLLALAAASPLGRVNRSRGRPG